MPTLHLSRTSLFWLHQAWSWVEFLAASCFVFVCLFVCLFLQLLKWVIILFLSLTSWRGFLVFCFCFVLFFIQNVPFPNHISRVRLIFFFFFFLSRRLVKFFTFFYFCLLVCFYFVLFCFFFFFLFPSKNFIPLPLISKYGAPLSLFYYTNDGGHYVIDNFEFPWRACNSVKNLISIWNFTNTFMKNVK